MERRTTKSPAHRGTAEILKVIVACLLVAAMAGDRFANADQADASISGLQVRSGTEGFLVSFQVTNAFPPDILERIHSGSPVSFRHRAELITKRGLPLMPGKVVSRATLITTARYESLTRRYHLTRKLEFRPRETFASFFDREEEVEAGTLQEMQAWMTDIRELLLPIPPEATADKRRRIRVSVTLGRRFVLFIFPSSHDVTAEWPLEL